MTSRNGQLDYTPDDGYTEKGYIKEEEGLHRALRFEYRPFLVTVRSRLVQQLDKLSQEKQDVRVAEELQKRLQSWSLADAEGAEVPLSLNVIQRLKPALFYKLYSIVLGTMPSDIDPEWNTETLMENVNAEAEAVIAPVPIGLHKEIDAEKNSETG